MRQLGRVLMLAAALGAAVCGGCQSGGTQRASDLTPSSATDMEFLDALNQTGAVSRAALLRGMLLVKTGSSSATFADNVAAAPGAGLGEWAGPTMTVTVGEASAVALRAVNGESPRPAEALRLAASNGLVREDRRVGDPLSGPELLALLDGVQGLIESGGRIDMPAAPIAPITIAPSTTAQRIESFDEFGSPAAARPEVVTPDASVPAAAPAPPAAPAAPPAPARADVPAPRPEPLPELPPAEPARPKVNPWMPGTPVPQKPPKPE